MHIVSEKTILTYANKHPEATTSFKTWVRTVRSSKWSKDADLKFTYNDADYVGNGRYVFNINFNNYRIVAKVQFGDKKVYIRFVGSHSEYNKIKGIENL